MRESEAPSVDDGLTVRECTSLEEFDECVRMQREAFGLPDLELSPRRHLIVSKSAGGWVLGAFDAERLVGFVLHLTAVRGREIIGYSHMMAVALAYQNRGVGARLKWAQRSRALSEGVGFIRWTFDPMQARNAHFNLNRLGVVVRSYAENFYGTDYHTANGAYGQQLGIDSDRLIAEWELGSARVEALARGQMPTELPRPALEVEITSNWSALLREDAASARREQLRVRSEFQEALAQGLACARFERDSSRPRYLFYREQTMDERTDDGR
ncbi:MAG TPA: GNAT family N-acetyltransferase [Pyrinomonadaceae bacterium]|jgi:predicted GNAT superfamily acetyltransferase